MTSNRRQSTPRPTGWVGWIAFAGVMMLMLGTFNAINGLAAIFTDDIFVTGEAGAVVLDVTSWGWVHLVVGAAVATTGAFLIQGAAWANVVAIVLVMLNMVTQMLLLPAYPFWSILIIVIDALVLWALIVHGDERIGDVP